MPSREQHLQVDEGGDRLRCSGVPKKLPSGLLLTCRLRAGATTSACSARTYLVHPQNVLNSRTFSQREAPEQFPCGLKGPWPQSAPQLLFHRPSRSSAPWKQHYPKQRLHLWSDSLTGIYAASLPLKSSPPLAQGGPHGVITVLLPYNRSVSGGHQRITPNITLSPPACRDEGHTPSRLHVTRGLSAPPLPALI